MYLKRFIVAASAMMISTAMASPRVMLQRMQQAHGDAIWFRLSCAKGSIIPTFLTFYPATGITTPMGGLVGASAGIIPGALSGVCFVNSESVAERVFRGAIMGLVVGAYVGGGVGLLSAPFVTYKFWKNFFGRRVSDKFIDVLADTSLELRRETFDYLNNQPERAIAEKYLAGDLYALAIFKTLLADSLA